MLQKYSKKSELYITNITKQVKYFTVPLNAPFDKEIYAEPVKPVAHISNLPPHLMAERPESTSL